MGKEGGWGVLTRWVSERGKTGKKISELLGQEEKRRWGFTKGNTQNRQKKTEGGVGVDTKLGNNG